MLFGLSNLLKKAGCSYHLPSYSIYQRRHITLRHIVVQSPAMTDGETATSGFYGLPEELLAHLVLEQHRLLIERGHRSYRCRLPSPYMRARYP